MKLGVIGLGRMGGNISLRLMKHGHECVVYDNSEKAVDGIAEKGAAKSTGLQDMVGQLPAPRVVWVMLPSGKITEDTVTALGGMMGRAATSSSMAATRCTRTTSAAPPPCARRASSMSTSAPRAASGGCSAAIA